MEKKKVYEIERKLLVHTVRDTGTMWKPTKIKETKWVKAEKTVYITATDSAEATQKYRNRYKLITRLNVSDALLISLDSLGCREMIDENNLDCKEELEIREVKNKSYEFLQHNLSFEDFVELLHQELFQTAQN